jgi:membrane protein YdbS with pleckstrin-like domain
MSAIPEPSQRPASQERAPSQRLAPHARWAWRLSWAGTCLAALTLLGMAGDGLPGAWRGIGMAVLGVALVVGTPVVPELRWRRWRWEVREHEIDLQRGIVVVRRTLIPMLRVQHVETERGPIGQALGLSTVEIHTAAGSHEIPLLRDGDAAVIRARIAELARTDADEPAVPADDGEPADPGGADDGEPADPDGAGEPPEPGPDG